ncbi:gluconate 2-dehydrogenase subunit 3 family protein [Brevibacillus sp. GCM10020057]|uniref:gluconate 2-dehydrogenase subunit 3 family protein n=1 Tax=Brevibacillus sp. GCM10020057 TaxID=3317327 RepID=UPI003634797E
MAEESRYPNYDVWEQHTKWDAHTKKVVGARRSPQVSHQFFTQAEALLLQTVVSVLVDDHRLEVLTYVTQHLDESTASPIGEAQRKEGVPPKKQLYRQGLAGIDAESHAVYGAGFIGLKPEGQQAIMRAVSLGECKDKAAWGDVPPADFFKQLLHDTVSAYYSHPLVWSEIGYGGPAYPRGYVRVEKGLTDPWEAKVNGNG